MQLFRNDTMTPEQNNTKLIRISDMKLKIVNVLALHVNFFQQT